MSRFFHFGLLLWSSLLLVVMTSCVFIVEENPHLKEIRSRAEWGDRYAQNELGSYYYLGYGIRQDYEQAVRWFEKAADNELALGQFNLGLCCLKGCGTPRDIEKAVQCFHKAANQGFSKAEFCLGCLFAEGYGVVEDKERAEYWFEKAANQGNREAMYALGTLNLENEGNDEQKALYWIRRAAYYGLPDAQYHYGRLLREGVIVGRDRDKSNRWLIRADQNGYTFSRYGEYYLGVFLLTLTQTREPITDKTYLLQPLEEKDIKTEASALYQQGFKLLFDGNVGQNNHQAIKCLIRSTLKGNKSAKILLSYCYATGIGTLMDQSAPSILFVGKARIRYEDCGGYTTIDFEIFEDGSFNKSISWQKG